MRRTQRSLVPGGRIPIPGEFVSKLCTSHLTTKSRCACDVPAHNYTFSWEPSGDTTAVYVSSQELFQYFDGFATKYNLHKYVRLEHQVIGSKWNGNSWDVDVQNRTNDHVFQDQCDILINASGILNNWKWPEIPGLHDFKGKLLHSANWNPNVDLHGKTVGLIGNG